jgi:phosphoglycerate dehydrogenase-like enzyme
MRVAVLDDYQRVARGLGPWDTLGPEVDVDFFADHVAGDDALIARLAPYDAVVAMRERTPFPRSRLERLPGLRLLVTTGMGNAAIDVGAAAELGIVVSGTGSLASPTAELTWGLILAVTRSICAEDRAVRAGGWQHTIGPELAGRTLGIVGLGRLGGRVAAIAQAFEMHVMAWSQNLRPERAAEVGAEAVTREELFARADVVTIHLKLSDRTRGLIGADDLARMKPGAYLVNTSRGPIVDEAALLDALHAGRIAGAGLDVFDVEPLPPEHPWRSAPNTVLTPHIGYVTTGTYERFFHDAVEDIAAFRAGRPVRVLRAAPPG